MIQIAPLRIGLAAVIGACLGSFTATAVVRQLRREQALSGRSRCDGCERPLSFWETTPLVSYAATSGRCRSCGVRIDPLHPAGEWLGAATLAAVWARPLLGVPDVLSCLLLTTLGLLLLALGLYDTRTLRLPDRLTAGVLVIGLGLAALNGLSSLALHSLCGALAYLLLEGVRHGYARLRARSGLGYGDVKLLAALAVWLGPNLAWGVVIAALSALAWIAIFGGVRRRIAFGPFIAFGAFAAGLGPKLASGAP